VPLPSSLLHLLPPLWGWQRSAEGQGGREGGRESRTTVEDERLLARPPCLGATAVCHEGKAGRGIQSACLQQRNDTKKQLKQEAFGIAVAIGGKIAIQLDNLRENCIYYTYGSIQIISEKFVELWSWSFQKRAPSACAAAVAMRRNFVAMRAAPPNAPER